MSILEDIDTSQWTAQELKAALDFLYGSHERFFDEIIRMHVEGEHKPRTQYYCEHEKDEPGD